MLGQFKEIYFATTSKSRLAQAKEIFNKTEKEIKQLPKIYAEIQADTGKEIAIATAKQASKEFRLPVIREYKSLFINALGGLPGQYVGHFSKKIPVDKLLSILESKKDRTGFFILDTILALPDGQIKEFSQEIKIRFSKKLLGEKGNWEKIIRYDNSDKTLAQENEEKHDEIWNKSLHEIAELIKIPQEQENNK